MSRCASMDKENASVITYARYRPIDHNVITHSLKIFVFVFHTRLFSKRCSPNAACASGVMAYHFQLPRPRLSDLLWCCCLGH